MSGAPVHRVRFRLIGRKDVIKCNLPDCLSVANLDISLLISSDSDERYCRSHRFNLAVEAYLQQFLSSESELVSKLMSKLATLKQSGTLHLMTSLHQVKQNLTCWTGASDIFACFERLFPTINQEDKECSEQNPSAAPKRNIQD